jgi:hypothetical protein
MVAKGGATGLLHFGIKVSAGAVAFAEGRDPSADRVL